ncbi:MAG: VWA domain-containing protein [Cytophagaceae bacterium]|nr:VWA domain-containing protein [Gemmatimonadaceae bacterium]
MHRRFLPLLVALMPAAALAQGRLISRPCQPPPPVCRPDADCVRPLSVDCGPQLVRSASIVKVALSNRVLRYEVTETFVNRSQRVAEADYIFPLPPGAAFEDLKLSINGELVSGETMTADKARGIYEEIVRRQRDPALVEWMGSGMLRTRIFPIAPGEEKKVVVRFQAAAQREGDALRIDYRRGSDPNATGSLTRPVVEQRGIASEGAGWTALSLLYERSSDYGDAYSPTHTLRTRDEGRTREVEARGSASDVTILLPLRRPDAAAISVLTHAPGDDGGFALFTITPPAVARRSLPRDVTFVIDVSGSMRGRKMEQAKEAGHVLLASLRAEDRFRIVDFSTDVRSFREGFTAATRENVREGRRYLDALVADGSTNISGALESALSTRTDGERLPLVVFMTDGEPTIGERNAERIAAMAAQQRGRSRVFAIGVSADVNAGLIEQLALEGHGTAHFVRDNESVERTVSLLATRLTSPVLTNVRLRVDGVRLSQVLPAGAIDVFAGQDMVVLARYSGSGSATVRLEGESVDGPVTWSTRARFVERDRANPFVARLWAAQRIGWLAVEKRRNGGSSEVDGEIRTLGERYGIPTEFTSYLVVEPGMQVAGARDASGSARQDVMRRTRDQSLAAPPPAPVTAQATGRAQGIGASVASAPAMAANERRFEDARASAKQREAKSTAELDEAIASPNTRRVGERLFSLANGVWTDARFTSRLRLVTVKPYSPAYFELMKQVDQLAPLFAIGDRVIVAGRTVAIELAPAGVERLSAADLAAVVRDW